jgi:hypothetical protein
VIGIHPIGDDLDGELAADVAQLARRLRECRPAPTVFFASRVYADLTASQRAIRDANPGHVSLTPGPLHDNSPG